MLKKFFYCFVLWALPIRLIHADALSNIVSDISVIVESQLATEKMARKHLEFLLVQTRMLAEFSQNMNLKNLGMIVYVGPERSRYEFTPDFVGKAIQLSATDLLPMPIWLGMSERQSMAQQLMEDLNNSFGQLAGYTIPLLPNETPLNRLSLTVQKFGEKTQAISFAQIDQVQMGTRALALLELPAPSKDKVMGYVNAVSALMFHTQDSYLPLAFAEIREMSKILSRILIDIEARVDVSGRLANIEQRLALWDQRLSSEKNESSDFNKVQRFRQAYQILSVVFAGEADCLQALKRANSSGS